MNTWHYSFFLVNKIKDLQVNSGNSIQHAIMEPSMLILTKSWGKIRKNVLFIIVKMTYVLRTRFKGPRGTARTGGGVFCSTTDL